MPLSTQGRDVVQNRIDYLKRRAQVIVDAAQRNLTGAIEDIAVAATLVREAEALKADLDDDAAEWELVELPVDCECDLCGSQG